MFQPQPQQIPILKFSKRGALVIGGNRAGKTVIGATETVYRLLGTHPFKPTHKPPIRVWCCSQDLPGKKRADDQHGQDVHKQMEELRRWLPRDALRGQSWARAFSATDLTLSLANGSLVVFKGYDQGTLKFESDAVHFCWFDEEPEDRTIFTSCMLRLADYDGQWMMTATPVLSLQGTGWIEDLWDQRDESTCDFEVFQLFTLQNPHLPLATVQTLLAGLTEEERNVRAEGQFARGSGLVLSEFNRAIHLVDDFVPPREWRHFLIIDPGWNTGAHLFAAVDPRGRIWLYGEHYRGKLKPAEHFQFLQSMRFVFGSPEYDVLMDPSAFYPKRLSTGHEAPSDVAEYLQAAEEAKATWFSPRPANNTDPMAWRVKRYLQADMLKVCRGLRWWLWEQGKWVRRREVKGVRAGERPVPQLPIDRYNHLMDDTRYLVNELPDPIPAGTEEILETSVQRHWRTVREDLDAAEQEQVWCD